MNLLGQPDILKMVEENDFDGLRRLLEHQNPEVRLQAASALAEMGDGGGWRFLEETVREMGDLDLRSAAALELGELGDPRAVPVLRDTLMKITSPASSRFTWALCRALETIGTPEAEQALRDAGYQPVLPEQHHTVIEYNDAYVKGVSPEAGEIRYLSAETHLNNAVELREAELAERGLVEANIALWMKPAWGYAWYVRGVLLEDLERPLEALLAYRKARHLDPNHIETREALDEIEDQVDPGAREPQSLLNQLVNDAWQERRDAAALLGETGGSEALDGLILALQDPEREVRHAALEALAHTATPELAPGLVTAVLEMQESSWLLRFARLYALARARSVEGLVTVLASEMERVQRSNPVFHAGKDPMLEVEYDLMQEVGVLALESTGDVEVLLALAEQNAWEEVEDEVETPAYSDTDLEDEEWIDDEMMDAMEQAAEEAEENLESYVDEVSQLAAAALDRLAREKMGELPVEIIRRLAQVPDLSLLDLSVEEPGLDNLVTVYDLGDLRAAAQAEISRRGA